MFKVNDRVKIVKAHEKEIRGVMVKTLHEVLIGQEGKVVAVYHGEGTTEHLNSDFDGEGTTEHLNSDFDGALVLDSGHPVAFYFDEIEKVDNGSGSNTESVSSNRTE